MKSGLLLFAWFFSIGSLYAQRTIKMNTLWTEPKVHVLFQGYTVSFTIKDINRSLELLAESGDSTYLCLFNLDTTRKYLLELYPGYRQEYRNTMQPLMQKGVGAFLLLAGHALIENQKGKKIAIITADIQPLIEGTDYVTVLFYDPKTRELLFSGQMLADMYNKDLGIE